ncbi:hypothetical protein FJU08_01140 [Martelella alba]|uniref:Uncharacterized protein n=1 Tax=Martelella alba TaxID=2590451 RepID=A0A506UIN8_9HYPH|nr:hypothetical protein [Martelella alba]TPW33201.1 hypothetical protein FJU08_01140 [Martelella alba]
MGISSKIVRLKLAATNFIETAPQKIINGVRPGQRPAAKKAASDARNGACPDENIRALLGASISPKTAELYRKQVQVDGVGKIRSLAQNKLSKRDIEVLVNSRIRPLSETPSVQQYKMLTPGEALVDLAAVLGTSADHSQQKSDTEQAIKTMWLDGTAGREAIPSLAAQAKQTLGENDQSLSPKIDRVVQNLEPGFFQTRRNDGYYSRLFDTELARYIVDNPSDGVLKTRDRVAAYLHERLDELSEPERNELCLGVASMMLADPPSWRANIDSAAAFLREPNPTTLKNMIDDRGQYSVPLVLHIAVKVMANKYVDTKEIKAATKAYIEDILPQRELRHSTVTLPSKQAANPPGVGNKAGKAARGKAGDQGVNKDAVIGFPSSVHGFRRTGIRLAYQEDRQEKPESPIGYGQRPLDRRILQPADTGLSPHDAVALTHERPTAEGMSGSSNLLEFAFRMFKEKDPTFPVDEARLATAAWLTYSGGHSFNEAYSVFNSLKPETFSPISYNRLAETSDLAARAVDHAYQQIVERSQELAGLEHSADSRSRH